jgi:altronate hydrolase
MAAKAILLRAGDSVAVAVEELVSGTVAELSGDATGSCPRALETVPRGHKLALRDIGAGEPVVKYGRPIGRATRDIEAGQWVHSHNLASALHAGGAAGGAAGSAEGGAGLTSAGGGYAWAGRDRLAALLADPGRGYSTSFEGYSRKGGGVGIRNEVWIVPTVGCVNGSAEAMARLAREGFGLDAYALTHPYGCSQLGDDLDTTRTILSRLARHPNAGAVLVLSLGCESNRLGEFREALGDYDRDRTGFIPLQEVEDETETASELFSRFAALLATDKRSPHPLSELRLGLKCGGSDGFSGITANPLVGRVCDLIVAAGGGAFMSEVPEMFGAEEELYERAADPEIRGAATAMIEGFKDYYASHDQPVYENPSPGNKDGGITTLEEKSLGCVRKAGNVPIAGILPYGGSSREAGLRLVSGPGNDLVSSTALAAAGAHIVLFTTGRGTPFGAPVPTLKISSNSDLAARKPGWIDFDAGRILAGEGFDALALELLRTIADTASGSRTRAEKAGHRGIAIFKEGVTL